MDAPGNGVLAGILLDFYLLWVNLKSHLVETLQLNPVLSLNPGHWETSSYLREQLGRGGEWTSTLYTKHISFRNEAKSKNFGQTCDMIGSVHSGTEMLKAKQSGAIREPLWNGAGQLLLINVVSK